MASKLWGLLTGLYLCTCLVFNQDIIEKRHSSCHHNKCLVEENENLRDLKSKLISRVQEYGRIINEKVKIIEQKNRIITSLEGRTSFVATTCLDNGIDNGWSCYYFSNFTTSWDNASEICRSMDSHLAIITAERENAQLVEEAQKVQIPGAKIAQLTVGFWLDGTDIVVEENWIWKTTGENLTYKNWYEGEPNGRNTENCLELRNTVSYKWNDYNCDERRYNQFICEREN